MEPLKKKLSKLLDSDIVSIDYFSKGQIGDIYKVVTSDMSYMFLALTRASRVPIFSNMGVIFCAPSSI